jgi:hypothetical protein
LIRYCRTNFAEAFVAWIHLKAIRVFVESVLRYGDSERAREERREKGMEGRKGRKRLEVRS